MVPIALGSQTAGPIIRPAFYCEIFGLKPTYGSISTAGVKGVSPSLDTLGAFARASEDLDMVWSVLRVRSVERTDPETDLGAFEKAPPRIGFAQSPLWDRAEQSTRTGSSAPP